ncbi:hypothetical protein HY214_04720 [Candidatus Roizmanbacteria bacterium]|nr:hypothetical protein [Candidatus Roizmanbacteria bacterium]
MLSTKKPYLIIPKFIEQPTWGGTEILKLKNWEGKLFLKDKKIGQSYELFGSSKLLLTITDSADERFIPEFGFADKPGIVQAYFPYKNSDFATISTVISGSPEKWLGKKISDTFGKMPLLNKINQAYGNSFQLHIKPDMAKNGRWQPKAESWYYFEDGLATCGIKEDCDIEKYKSTCQDIEKKMKQLSEKVRTSKTTINGARMEAEAYIKGKNPWQFVKMYDIKRDTLLDLSAGGIHHSWEENKQKYPKGNFLYEIQQDVMDPVCTIRSFDQGKFKDDGTIRSINILDYFRYLDTDPEHNDIRTLLRAPQGKRLLTTKNYSMDICRVDGEFTDSTNGSFVHLFAREGRATVKAQEGSVTLTRGHSCFLPAEVNDFSLVSLQNTKVVILKTFIDV